MTDPEIDYFELLKSFVQAQYLKNHTPSHDNISKWKGIDIIYFQEDLRKIAKGNISEKTFYTYFKTIPNTKLPRIDMLNLLAQYVGFSSWYEFKKKNPLENTHEETSSTKTILDVNDSTPIITEDKKLLEFDSSVKTTSESTVTIQETIPTTPIRINYWQKIKQYGWLIATFILSLMVLGLAFGDKVFGKTYTYCFIDSDRNSNVNNTLEIKVIKENESPIWYRIKPGECFYYHTKDKILKMEITSPYYEKTEVIRNLQNAPTEESIELKPDEYSQMLNYYSNKDVNSTSTQLIKNKQLKLNHLISDNALIYQVFDNEIYGVETLTKQKYIGLVTTPTKSLKNLKVIETKREKGKIVLIKFKIETDETK